MVDAALQGTIFTGALGLLTLLLSRIRCMYRRDQEGQCNPICACTEKGIQEDHQEIEVKEVVVGGHEACSKM